MGPVHQNIRIPLPVAHLFNILQKFSSLSLDLKGPDTDFFKPRNKIQGKKSKIKMSEMSEHTFPESCIKIIYTKIISLQKT